MRSLGDWNKQVGATLPGLEVRVAAPALGLLLFLHGDATHAQREPHGEQWTDHAHPVSSIQHRNAHQPDAPPLQHFPKVVGVPRPRPQP